jgi:hypothetical protein
LTDLLFCGPRLCLFARVTEQLFELAFSSSVLCEQFPSDFKASGNGLDRCHRVNVEPRDRYDSNDAECWHGGRVEHYV